MRKEKNQRLSSLLVSWYENNKRDLPWRHTKDPYIIWLSEVILQQTRVDQGYSYFNRFANRFPSVNLLADADEQEVLKLWQGLGYYSRARNLHATAKMIMTDFGGVFPSNYKDVLSLKGVGEYTAAAIVSFAYNQPYAVVDGNVYRVLSRIFGIETPIDSTTGKKLFAELAQELLNEDHPGLHNQAIMEFGALYCVPVLPDCANCCMNSFCLAYSQNAVSKYPVKQGKTKVRNRYFHYFDIEYGDFTYLNKRTVKDIWQNLYEFPLIETEQELSLQELQTGQPFTDLFKGANVIKISLAAQHKHVLSHQIIYAYFYSVQVEGAISDKYLQVDRLQIDDYPISRLTHKYLENL